MTRQRDLFAGGLFTEFPDNQSNTLCARLFDLLDDAGFTADRRRQLGQALEAAGLARPQAGERTSSAAITRTIRGRVSQLAYASLLNSILSPSHPLSKTYDVLRGHVLGATLINEFGRDEPDSRELRLSRNKACLDALRRMAKEDAATGLFKETAPSFEAIRARLDALLRPLLNAHDAPVLDHMTFQRLTKIDVIFRDLADDARAPSHPEHAGHDQIYRTFFSPVLDAEQGPSFTLAIEQNFKSPSAAALFEDVEAPGPALNLHLATSDPEANATPANHAFAARAVFTRIARERARPPALFNAMTRLEAQQLFQTCHKYAHAQQIPVRNRRGLIVLLASLSLGRTPRQICDLLEANDGDREHLLEKEGTIVWRLAGIPRRSYADKRVMEPHCAWHEIRMPVPLGSWLVHIREQGVIDPDLAKIAERLLQKLDTGCRTHASGRVAKAHGEALARLGHDESAIALLAGDRPELVAGQYYVRLAPDRLQAIYEAGFKAIAGNAMKFDAHDGHADQTAGGSSLVPRRAVVRAFLREARQLAVKLSSGSVRELVAYHNRYCAMVVANLMFMTGHRLVRSPFNSMLQFDLKRGFCHISDKQRRGSACARIVPLPRVAIGQIQDWNAHLLAVRILLATERVSRAVQPHGRRIDPNFHTMGPAAPLFFVLELRPDGAIGHRAFRPADGELLLEDIWPQALRTSRHMLRTHMFENALPSDLSDCLMGHAEPGREPFALHSALSLAQLEPLRAFLDDHCRAIGTRSIRGLGKRG